MGNADELLDVVDPATGAVREQRSRREVHELGLWHQVFHCLVVRPSARTVVLQRRALVKAAFPGKLDLSATGHLAAGESPADGVRELTEELGIVPAAGALVLAGSRLLADDQGEGLNRELVHLHLLADDRALDNYVLAADEVTEVVEVRTVDLLALLDDRFKTAPIETWSPTAGPGAGHMTRTDLVADSNGYWVVAVVMADRFLRGEGPLAV